MARLRAATTTTAKGKTAAGCAGALQHRCRAAGPPRSTSRSAVRVAPAADGGGSPLHGGRIRQIPAAGGIWERSTLAWCGLRRDWRAVWRGGEARPVRSLTLLSSRRHGKRHAGGRGQPRLKLGTHRGCLDGPVDSVGYDGSGAGSVPRRLVNSRRCGWRCRSGPACGGLDRIELRLCRAPGRAEQRAASCPPAGCEALGLACHKAVAEGPSVRSDQHRVRSAERGGGGAQQRWRRSAALHRCRWHALRGDDG